MKNIWKKNKIIIIVVVVIAAVAGILLLTREDKTLQDNFAVQDIETITKIYMSDKKDRQLLLERQDDDKWKLNKKYAARPDIMENLLSTLREMRISRPTPRTALKNVIETMAASSTKVEIYQTRYRINLFDKIKLFPHEKLTKVIYVGYDTQDNMGTYMLLKGEEKPYVIYKPGFRGFLSPNFLVVEDLWRDRLIFDYSAAEIQSIEVKTRNPQDAFKLEKTERFFTLTSLASNQKILDIDTAKVIDYISSFRNIAFDGFKNNMDKQERDTVINKVIPEYILTITGITGKKSSIKVYEKPWNGPSEIDEDDMRSQLDKDMRYALVYNDADLVLIQNYIFDRILKPISYFIRQPENIQAHNTKQTK